jgi:O-antigen ligase
LYEAFSYERWRSEYYGLGRVYFVATTFTTVFPASPVFGFGPGQYGGGAVAALGNHSVYEQLGIPYGIYGTSGQIDNNWLSLLGETGAIGLILYLFMIVGVARFSYRVFRRSSDRFLGGVGLGFLGALLAVCFQAGLGTQLEVRTLGVYLWLIPALLYVATKPEFASPKSNENPPRQ